MRAACVAAGVCLVMATLGCLNSTGSSGSEIGLGQRTPGNDPAKDLFEDHVALRRRAEACCVARVQEDWASLLHFQF